MEGFLIYNVTQGTGTFTNNIIYVYIFGCVAILNYSAFSKAQKIVLIYLSTISMRLFVPTKTIFTTIIMLITIFLVEEYLNPDQEKMRIIHSWHAKVMDYIYSFFFIDAGAWMLLTLFVLSGKGIGAFLRLFGGTIAPWVTYTAAFILAWKTMHCIVAPRFVVKEFKDINFYFAKFIERDLNLDSYQVRQRLELLTELEDKSYFVRQNSYNWISVEFLKYKIRGSYGRTTTSEKGHLWHTIQQIVWWTMENGFRKFFERAGEEIHFKVREMCYWLKSIIRRIRGGSTLEMQLIRQIAIEEGYQYVLQRKIYEFAATFIFFPQLKKYYQRNEVGKKEFFKEFILYIYLQSVPVKVNKVRFPSIARLMECVHKKESEDGHVLHIEDYDITELYVAYLALTGAPVSDKRLVLYIDVVERYGIDLNYAKWFSEVIRDRVVKPDEKIEHQELLQMYETYVQEERRPWECFYQVGYATLPFVENNIYYGEPGWPSYGYRACWSFAWEVYWRIWGEGFNSFAGTDNDLLRHVGKGDERRITVDNAKRFLSAARPGAVIRISDTIEGTDTEGTKYHSQIMLEHDSTGVVIYESTNGGTWIDHYTWGSYVACYGEYEFFKYIKFPGAEPLGTVTNGTQMCP